MVKNIFKLIKLYYERRQIRTYLTSLELDMNRIVYDDRDSLHFIMQEWEFSRKELREVNDKIREVKYKIVV